MMKHELRVLTSPRGRKIITGVEIKVLRGRGSVQLRREELVFSCREKGMSRGFTVPILPPLLETQRRRGGYMFLTMHGNIYMTGYTRHREVITPLGFPCDEAMAPLIMELNALGHGTRYSCQGDCLDGVSWSYEGFVHAAYVKFSDEGGAAELISMVRAAGFQAFLDDRMAKEFSDCVRFDPAYLGTFSPSGFPRRDYPQQLEIAAP